MNNNNNNADENYNSGMEGHEENNEYEVNGNEYGVNDKFENNDEEYEDNDEYENDDEEYEEVDEYENDDEEYEDDDEYRTDDHEYEYDDDEYDELENKNIQENYNYYEELKSKLIELIERVDIIELSSYIYQNYEIISVFSSYAEQKRQQEMLKNHPRNEADIIIAQKMEEELPVLNEEEYGDLKRKYQDALDVILVLENDEEISQYITEKFESIEYDANSIESRAIIVQVLACLLGGHLTYDDGETTFLYNDLQKKIAETLSLMTIDDLNLVYLEADNLEINIHSIYNEVFTEKFSQMTDTEFLTYSCYAEIPVEQMDECEVNALKKRIVMLNNMFASTYIESYVDCSDLVCELLRKVRPEQRVEALISSNVFQEGSEELQELKRELIEKFSEEELVRYCTIVCGEEQEPIAQIVKEKLAKISNENLKFLLYAYGKRNYASYRENQIEDIIIERIFSDEATQQDLEFFCSEYEPGLRYTPKYSEKEIMDYEIRLNEYEYTESLFSCKMPNLNQPQLAQIEPNQSDISMKNVIENYETNLQNMIMYNKFLNYIIELANTDDKQLLRVVVHANKNYSKDGLEDQIIDYWDFINDYLRSRILNMEDYKPLVVLSYTQKMNAPLSGAIHTRLQIESNKRKNMNKNNNDKTINDPTVETPDLPEK